MARKCLFAASVAASIVAQTGFAQEIEIELDPIVVGAGQDKVASDVPQSVSVVNEETIANLQAGSLSDILLTVPGVSNAGSSSIFGQSFNIRGVGTGLGSTETSIYTVLDGQKKYYESYRQGSVFIDPELLKSVEILRGPGASTLYSSGAMGGGVVMETKDASDFLEDGDNFVYFQKLGYESNPDTLLSTSILAFRPQEGFEILAGLTLRDLGETKDGDGNVTFANDTLVPTGLLKISRDFSGPSSLEFSAMRLYNSEDNQPLDQIFGGANRADVETIDDTFSLTYGYNPEENPLLDLSVILSNTKTEKTLSNSPFGGAFDGNRFYDTNALKIENISDIRGDGSIYLTAGIGVSEEERFSDPASASHQKYDTRTYEAYALGEFMVSDRLDVTIGARLERKEITPVDLVTPAGFGTAPITSSPVSFTGFEPQIAALYRLNDNWNVFGSIARVERLPTGDEIYDQFQQAFGGPPIGPGAINLNLQPEKGVNLELGASFSGFDVLQSGDEMTLKGTVFQNKIDGRIGRTLGNAPTPSFDNLQDVTIRGLELEANYGFEQFFANANLTYIEGSDDATGATMDSLQNNSVQVTLGYNFSEAFVAQISGTFAKSRAKANGTVVPGYGVVDLATVIRPQSGPLEGADIRIGIDNLFDKTYVPAAHYVTGATTDQFSVADGRNVKISIGKTF
ncbi:MAG: TonB-dependent receptor [Pseudomonadota bacterium]